MLRSRRLVALSAALSLFASAFSPAARADHWPQWRGPHLNGAGDAKGLPDKIAKDQNVAWSTPMPGPSAGTPIVWGEKIFVSSLDNKTKKLLAMCVGRKDGKVIWQKEVGEGSRMSGNNNMASPSPITDGKHVWFFYGTGDLACFDLAGKQRWARNLTKEHGSFNVMHIYGSSPLLYEGKLYIQVIHRDMPYGGGQQGPSYLLAVDPTNGKDLWKQVRKDEAVDETKEAYGTPIPYEGAGRKEVVLIGGDVVTGHDAATGKELWRCGGWNPEKIGHWRLVPSVVVVGDLMIACTPKGGPVFAIKGGGKGDVTTSHVAWKSGEISSDVCVPLVYNDNLYVLNGDGNKTITCVEPKTGKAKWSHKLGGGPVFRASPTGADGKIYCMNEEGEVWVVSADEPKTLSQADLGGGGGGHSRGSISLVGNQAFVRTADTLYCFAKK